MTTLKLRGRITEDRQLVVEIPEGVIAQEVEITVEVAELEPGSREWVIAKLAADGILIRSWTLPDDHIEVEDDEPVTLLPGSPTMDQLIDDERGPR